MAQHSDTVWWHSGPMAGPAICSHYSYERHAWMLHEVDGMGCWQLPALRELSVCQPRSSAVAVRYR